MRNYIIVALSAITFFGCDKIPSRVPPPPPDCVFKDSVIKNNADVSGTKKVLLEDYTGHYCGQCPPAAAEAERITANTEGKVVVLACHVSETFAAPRVGKYLEDFRDEASDEWDKYLGMSAAGLPKGTINRVKVSNQFPLNYSAWAGIVNAELAKPQVLKLDVTSVYEPNQKLLRVRVKGTFLKAADYNVRLQIVLSQDGIVSDQRDYAPPAGATIVGDRRPDYKFDHIMVKSINGVWGELFKAKPIAVNESVSTSKDCNLVSKCFYTNQVCLDDSKLSVVVFAYNEETKEVIQVEKVKIR